MSDDLSTPMVIPCRRITRGQAEPVEARMPVAADLPAVLDLGAARLAREAEAQRLASLRSFVVAVHASALVICPPGAEPDAGTAPETLLLNAADLVGDPGRLGEIARALVARAEAARSAEAPRAG